MTAIPACRTPRMCVRLAAVSLFLCAMGVSCRKNTTQRHVVLYCSADQAVAEPIVARFERDSGIRVLARYDEEASKTVGLVQRLRAEANAPIADVFWSNEIFHTIRLAREGLLANYATDAAGDRPGHLVDPERRWHGFALRARVIGYSTNRVGAEEVPDRLEDLLDADWKGRLVMASPAFGTTGGDVASWFAHYGPAKARAILAGLKANDVRLVDSNSTAVRMVATGQADVCFTDTDDVYVAQRNGWPVAMRFLDQGGDGALTVPNTVALITGGPHPREARALVDFLLGETAEKMLARSDSHNTPVHPSLTGLDEFAKYAIPKALDIDYEKVADHLPEAVRVAGGILR